MNSESCSLNKRKEKKDQQSSIWIDACLKLVAVGSVIASVLGYGVVIGLASSIGIDHLTVLTGPFDALVLSWPGFISLISSLDKLDVVSILNKSFEKSMPVVFVSSGLFAVFAFLQRFKWQRRNFKTWIHENLIASQGEEIGRSIVKATKGFVGSYLATTLFLISAPLVGMLVIYVVIIIFLLIPTIGFTAGQAYFHKYILAPEHCAQFPSRASFSETKTPVEAAAACVSITTYENGRSAMHYGRVVLSSSSYMLIYHPDTGLGERIPIANALIQSIDDADIARLNKIRKKCVNGPESHGC